MSRATGGNYRARFRDAEGPTVSYGSRLELVKKTHIVDTLLARQNADFQSTLRDAPRRYSGDLLRHRYGELRIDRAIRSRSRARLRAKIKHSFLFLRTAGCHERPSGIGPLY